MTPTNKQVDILVVEDDEHKLRAISQFLSEEMSSAIVSIAQSLSSAVGKISSCQFQIAIIDMSLPTYDFAVDKAGGGQPQGVGGADLLRFIEAESPETFTVVLTQHEEFASSNSGEMLTVQQLSSALRAELGERFLGVIQYTSQYGEWRKALIAAIRSTGEK